MSAAIKFVSNIGGQIGAAIGDAGASGGDAKGGGSFGKIIGILGEAVGAFSKGSAGAAAHRDNAAASRANAGIARDKGRFEAERTRLMAKRAIASQNVATQGLRTDSGSPLAVLGDLAGEGELDALAAIYSAELDAVSLENQARLDDAAASRARQAGFGAAAGAVVNGLSTFGSKSEKPKSGKPVRIAGGGRQVSLR